MASYGLALGIAQVDQQLPDPVYPLLSGLNAATVGIIALAAVQLSQKAITDKISRILVFFGATAGMLYNALWYFPVLMAVGGITTIIWDYRWLHNFARRLKLSRRKEETTNADVEASDNATELTRTAPADTSAHESQASSSKSLHESSTGLQSRSRGVESSDNTHELQADERDQERTVPEALNMRVFSWKFGTALIACFFITFTVIMVLRGVLENRPRGFSLFANLYLAGTIIFGGGPVVIPLLRE